MKEDNHENDSDEEDSWALYADAGYGHSDVEVDEISKIDTSEDDVWYDGDDFEFEGATINWDVVPWSLGPVVPWSLGPVVPFGPCLARCLVPSLA